MASLPPSVASAQNFTLPEIPELYRPDFLDVLVPAPPVEDKAAPQSVKSNPMMSALQSIPTFTLTQNGAPTFNTTGSPTLDAFQFVKDQRGSALDILLCNSWKEDPALTLRVIWNLRSIRDGKGDREGFYRYENLTTSLEEVTDLLSLLQCIRMAVQKAPSYRNLESILASRTCLREPQERRRSARVLEGPAEHHCSGDS